MSFESHTAAFVNAPRPLDVTPGHSPPATSRQTNSSETCASSDAGEDVEEIEAIIEAIQASDIPISYAQKTSKKRRKFFSVKLSHSHAQKANDPFDYQHKYPEDAPFQEMGEMARVWKMFLEEYLKYDTEMVDDWRDGLDVLLVFAGLFSAVVTTFLVQTAQSLQVNMSMVTASIMDEMLHMQRAFFLNEPIENVTRSALAINSVASPSPTDRCVNGMWFTSLALSLTTALLAVLTKQWIHQYMTVPSGTPRGRSRIRQYRFDSLESWHVPVIIGLLPVLMHLALGVFFGGLVLYLRALDTSMAVVVGMIASFAFVAYFGTTFLPTIKPNCPYKTPLTVYSYSAFGYLCVTTHTLMRCIRQLLDQHLPALNRMLASGDTPAADGVLEDDLTTVSPGGMEASRIMSLRAVERERVEEQADIIDARALAWIFDMSSNSSVQATVMEALSIMPLQSVWIVKEKFPSIAEDIHESLRSQRYSDPEGVTRTTYDRLYRAFARFDTPDCVMPTLSVASPNSFSALLNYNKPDLAATFLSEQLKGFAQEKFDVLLWAKLLQNALNSGISWLQVEDNNSTVWTGFLSCILGSHWCAEAMWNCDDPVASIVSLPLHRRGNVERLLGGPLDYDNFCLEVLDRPDTHVATTFADALKDFMHPSLCDFLLSTVYANRCLSHEFIGLPSDILLHLAMIQSPSVWSSSRSAPRPATTILKLVKAVRVYAGVDGQTYHKEDNIFHRHKSIIRATFRSLSSVVLADTFLTETLTAKDKRDMLHPFFRTLNFSPHLSAEFFDRAPQCLLTHICDLVVNEIPIIGDDSEPIEVAAEILESYIRFPSSSNLLGPLVYEQLVEKRWINLVQEEFTSISTGLGDRKTLSLSYLHLASAFVDGLGPLSRTAPQTFSVVLRYIREQGNLVTLCMALMIADRTRQVSLNKLAQLFLGHSAEWNTCLGELERIVKSQDGRVIYDWYTNAYDVWSYFLYSRDGDCLPRGRNAKELVAVYKTLSMSPTDNLATSQNAGDKGPLTPPPAGLKGTQSRTPATAHSTG